MAHNDITIRVIAEPLIIALSCEKPDEQKKLIDKTRAFVMKELVSMQAPMLKPEAWDSAIVEVVSGFTLARIKKLESLLREVINDEYISEDLSERIENEIN